VNLKENRVLLCVLVAVATFVSTLSLCAFGGYALLQNSILGDEGAATLSEVKAYIDATYLESYDEKEMYNMAAKGMTSVLDPYTNYYTPEEFKAFMESTQGAYVGVGLVLVTNEENQIMISQVYEDSPGAKAGVKAGDILLRVDGTAFDGDAQEAAANALRGTGDKQKAGTSCEATFLRGTEEYSVTITREEIHLKTVSARIEKGDIGYFAITAFDEDTDVEFKEAYTALKEKGIEKIVIDLRDNGGGDFQTVCRLAGMFVEEDKVLVYCKDKNEKCTYEYAKGYCVEEPVVILANGGSASASEVFIGALKGNGRLNCLVGTKTFGKGITQNVYALRNGGGLTVTVSRYYTPDDQCIHGIGFTPDLVVESGYEEDYPVAAIPRSEDVQLDKALEIANGI